MATKGLQQNFLVGSMKHVGQIVLGYIAIRKQGIVGLQYSSKILVRPVIETTFYVVASFNHPEVLLWKVRKEIKEEKKLLREIGSAESLLLEKDETLKSFEQQFNNQFPGCQTKHPEAGQIKTVADKAQLLAIYTRSYGIYCNFTHGGVRAFFGDLHQLTDPHDNATLCWCLIAILDSFRQHGPIKNPDLEKLPHLLAKLNALGPDASAA